MAYNVLIVDDSQPMRKVIKKVITASRFDVGNFFEANDGRQALSILKHHWIDLVLADYNMPGLNGLQLMEMMRMDDILRSIPVVIISTEGSRPRVDQFLGKGAAGYIKKPFTPEQVKATLDGVMGGAGFESPNTGANTNNDGCDF